MALNDWNFKSGQGQTLSFRRDDRDTSAETTTRLPGEMVKRGGAGGNFAVNIQTGDPTFGGAGGVIVLGIVTQESTETATANGTVKVATINPGSVLVADATTAANVDLDSELLLLLNDFVAADVAAAVLGNGVQTIDEDQGDDPNVNGLMIIDGDVSRSRLDVVVQPLCCFGSGALVGQTMD